MAGSKFDAAVPDSWPVLLMALWLTLEKCLVEILIAIFMLHTVLICIGKTYLGIKMCDILTMSVTLQVF